MFNGILPVWKEKGMTSHDVVFKLRRILKMKKIGHTGTLDPEVEGVLLVCLGQATKLVEFLMDGEKIYQGEITLGYSTETEDAHGEIVEEKPVMAPLSNEVIDAAMAEFKGDITQIPPYYSAVKVNGRRLYEYARAGETVERPRRIAKIDYFKRTNETVFDSETQQQKWQFEVKCGKGTYVRTLAVDLGTKLGYPSHMSQLTRMATGGVSADQTLRLAEIQEKMDNHTIEDILLPIESGLTQFPQLAMTGSQFEDVKNGKVLAANYFGSVLAEPTVLTLEGKVKAIYQPHPTQADLIKPQKMFLS
ncbi:tRNA pseudouridine(55) synthase TruB [Aerococcaceae bacterium DSM 109653]|uniref:tRNA pseudouridine synthase B n=1 Tax=Fundicoccus ignavus TaxID=2664442 RepID=A0A844BL69_9LACT|nr:tRNA pseudouridine(55) synthase TruB [Fundicoccus ignavus]MRI82650.1 tRNA pseudouridine(55) synthase TruB [Fundicoccus ignavus]